MKFAPEGLPFILTSLLLAAAAWAAALPSGQWHYTVLAALLTVVAGWVAWFFRNPDRHGERGDRVVIAPADGRVVHITRLTEPTFVNGECVRVSIFMNVFDVHVNRYPVNGTVSTVTRTPGKFLNAVTEASSTDNEHASVGILSGGHRILVRQIAGLIARRIITDSRVGDAAVQGNRMGLIRFGSRVDVFLPLSAELSVNVGDRTQSGVTVIARLPEASNA